MQPGNLWLLKIDPCAPKVALGFPRAQLENCLRVNLGMAFPPPPPSTKVGQETGEIAGVTTGELFGNYKIWIFARKN